MKFFIVYMWYIGEFVVLLRVVVFIDGRFINFVKEGVSEEEVEWYFSDLVGIYIYW